MSQYNLSNIPEEQLDIIFYHGAYPLWQYLQDILGINIVDVCPRVAKEQPILNTSVGTLIMEVVDLPHAKQLDHMSNNDIIFLANSVKVVYETLKVGIEKDGEKILAAYEFKIDSNHNMFLVDSNTDLPISSRGIAIVQQFQSIS